MSRRDVWFIRLQVDKFQPPFEVRVRGPPWKNFVFLHYRRWVSVYFWSLNWPHYVSIVFSRCKELCFPSFYHCQRVYNVMFNFSPSQLPPIQGSITCHSKFYFLSRPLPLFSLSSCEVPEARCHLREHSDKPVELTMQTLEHIQPFYIINVGYRSFLRFWRPHALAEN